VCFSGPIALSSAPSRTGRSRDASATMIAAATASASIGQLGCGTCVETTCGVTALRRPSSRGIPSGSFRSRWDRGTWCSCWRGGTNGPPTDGFLQRLREDRRVGEERGGNDDQAEPNCQRDGSSPRGNQRQQEERERKSLASKQYEDDGGRAKRQRM